MVLPICVCTYFSLFWGRLCCDNNCIHTQHACLLMHTNAHAHTHTNTCTQRHTHVRTETHPCAHQSVPVRPLRYTLQLVTDQYFQQQQIECLLTPFSLSLTLFFPFLIFFLCCTGQSLQNKTPFQVIACKIWSVLCN